MFKMKIIETAMDYENNELRPKFFMKGISLLEENTTDELKELLMVIKKLVI